MKRTTIIKNIICYVLTIAVIVLSIITTIQEPVRVYADSAHEYEPEKFDPGDGTKEGIRAGLFNSMKYLRECIKAKGEYDEKTVIQKTWQMTNSMRTFYDNRYPFDLSSDHWDGPDEDKEGPHIGDVLHQLAFKDGCDGYDGVYEAQMDDVNFAEFLTVLSQSKCAEVGDNSEGFLWGTNNYNDFEKFMIDEKKCVRWLYEVEVEWDPWYYGEERDEYGNVTKVVTRYGSEVGYGRYDNDISAAPQPKGEPPEYLTIEGVECEYKEFKMVINVKPYGLRELYRIAFPEYGSAPAEAFKLEQPDFYMHDNDYMLDYTERVVRIYQRYYEIITKRKITDYRSGYERGEKIIEEENQHDALGPSAYEKRSKLSPIWKDISLPGHPGAYEWLAERDQASTGRSGWYYILETYNESLDKNSWAGDYLAERYEDEDDLPPDINLEDYLKWLEEQGIDAESLLKIPRFFQSDSAWKNFILGYAKVEKPPGSGNYVTVEKTIGSSGCGFTSMAMIAAFMTGKNINPATIGSMFKNFYTPGKGAQHSLFPAVAQHYGFQCKTMGLDAVSIAQQLQQGHPVLVSFKGDGYYTSGGHLCVITGVDKNGDFIVNDPNSNNQKKYGNVYKKEDILAHTKNVWSFSK